MVSPPATKGWETPRQFVGIVKPQVVVQGEAVQPEVQVEVAVAPSESVTCAVKLKVPAPVGVPEICPVVGFRLTPGGRLPAMMAKEYAGIPPLSTSCELSDWP